MQKSIKEKKMEQRRIRLLSVKKDGLGNLYLTYETTQGEQVYNMNQDGILHRRVTRPLPDKLYDLDIAEAYQTCRFLSERDN